MTNRVPPHNADAERALLGAFMLKPSTLDEAELDPDDFYVPAHRETYRAIQQLRARLEPVDTMTVADELTRMGKLAAIGGLARLSDFIESSPLSTTNVGHYAAIVRREARKLRFVQDMSDLAARAFAPDADLDELLEDAFGKLRDVTAAAGGDPTRSLAQLALEGVRKLKESHERRERGEGLPVVPTGLKPIDDIIGGWPLSVVSILAGRPSHGKSALARTVCENAAGAGIVSHVFGMDDSSEAFTLRSLSDESGVPLTTLHRVEFDAKQFGRVDAAAGRIMKGRGKLIHVDDSTGLSAQQIAIRVRRRRREFKTGLVVVDFLQLLHEKPPTRASKWGRYEQVSESMKGLVHLAKTEKLPVVVLCQMNRGIENRDDQRPKMSDLRESGDIEQDAAVILFVYRPEKFKPNAQKNLGVVEVAKQKQGPTGAAHIWFNKATATYCAFPPAGVDEGAA